MAEKTKRALCTECKNCPQCGKPPSAPFLQSCDDCNTIKTKTNCVSCDSELRCFRITVFSKPEDSERAKKEQVFWLDPDPTQFAGPTQKYLADTIRDMKDFYKIVLEQRPDRMDGQHDDTISRTEILLLEGDELVTKAGPDLVEWATRGLEPPKESYELYAAEWETIAQLLGNRIPTELKAKLQLQGMVL
jgi:hypothetical protein